MSKPRWLPVALSAATASLAVAAAVAVALPVNADQDRAASVMALPAHELTGYWQNFVNGATNLRIANVSNQYDLVVVAFADATATPGAVSFTLDPALSSALGGYTKAQFIADIATLKSRGKTVIISVGGETGRVAVNDAASATNFANSVHALMNEYGFQGVDIDLENGLNPTYMASALRQLSSRAPGYTLTMAPQTIDVQGNGGSYFELIKLVKDITTVVHTQYYNSGSMLGCDGRLVSQGNVDFITAQACILLGVLRPDQVALGLPASPRGAGSGYVAPSIVNNALDCLAKGTNCGSFRPSQTWPGIRGAMTWSVNWDALNGYNFANTVGPHLDTLPGQTTPTPGPTGSPSTSPSTSPTPTPGPTGAPSACPTGPVPSPTPPPVGAIGNPGFESGFIYWTCQQSASITGTGARSGSRALLGAPAGHETARVEQVISVRPNTRYTVSAYVNGSYVYLGAGDASTWTPGTGGAYQRLAVTVTTGASQSTLRIYVHGWYGQPEFRVDDLAIVTS
jgi:chitinase